VGGLLWVNYGCYLLLCHVGCALLRVYIVVLFVWYNCGLFILVWWYGVVFGGVVVGFRLYCA